MRYSVALLAAVAAFGLSGCPGKSKKTSSPAPAEQEMRAAVSGGPPSHPASQDVSIATEEAFEEGNDRGLMDAVMSGRLKDVQGVLLRRNPDVNVVDSKGFTPLTRAVLVGQWAIGSELLEGGADVTCPVPAGLPPLILQAVRAVEDGQIRGQREFLKKLIVKGASVDKTDDSGKSALMMAAMNGNLSSVTVLLKNGADVNLADAKGRTALMMVAIKNDYSAFRQLMRAGASADMIDNEGKTALDLVPRDRRELFETCVRKVTLERLNPQPSHGSEAGDSD